MERKSSLNCVIKFKQFSFVVPFKISIQREVFFFFQTPSLFFQSIFLQMNIILPKWHLESEGDFRKIHWSGALLMDEEDMHHTTNGPTVPMLSMTIWRWQILWWEKVYEVSVWLVNFNLRLWKFVTGNNLYDNKEAKFVSYIFEMW